MLWRPAFVCVDERGSFSAVSLWLVLAISWFIRVFIEAFFLAALILFLFEALWETILKGPYHKETLFGLGVPVPSMDEGYLFCQSRLGLASALPHLLITNSNHVTKWDLNLGFPLSHSSYTKSTIIYFYVTPLFISSLLQGSGVVIETSYFFNP